MGASYFEHTQTLEIPCEAMNTGSLAQNSKNVHQIDYDAFTDCVLAVLLSSWLSNRESWFQCYLRKPGKMAVLLGMHMKVAVISSQRAKCPEKTLCRGDK